MLRVTAYSEVQAQFRTRDKEKRRRSTAPRVSVSEEEAIHIQQPGQPVHASSRKCTIRETRLYVQACTTLQVGFFKHKYSHDTAVLPRATQDKTCSMSQTRANNWWKRLIRKSQKPSSSLLTKVKSTFPLLPIQHNKSRPTPPAP